MTVRYARSFFAAAALVLAASAAQGADIQNMLGECRVRAATIFGTPVEAVQVKYEGQRVDKTHVVNGAVFVRGQNETFQCSFERDGYTWKLFIVNFPQR